MAFDDLSEEDILGINSRRRIDSVRFNLDALRARKWYHARCRYARRGGPLVQILGHGDVYELHLALFCGHLDIVGGAVEPVHTQRPTASISKRERRGAGELPSILDFFFQG